ncbi:MAG TPA: CHAD domain-containing protein [Terriglobia bacterium]|jgi:CHAD domain-containing protein
MSFDVERVRKSSRRIHKFLKKNPKRPSSDAIHRLRTGVRSLETVFETLGLDSKKRIKRLLRDLKSVRKSAGKVRDMDVLTADALTLGQVQEQDCLVQLLEYLGAERNRYARKLRRLVAASGAQLRRDVKRNFKYTKKLLEQAEENPAGSRALPATLAKTFQLSSELTSEPRITKNNLHPYRIKVKELRDILQLAEGAADPRFLEMLGGVKDAIGEWHDWSVLAATAGDLLDHGPSCRLTRHLKEVVDSKFQRALLLTGQLREKYLSAAPRSNQKSRPAGKGLMPAPIINAAASIAAG